MPTVKGFLWRMGGAFAVLVFGLTLAFWALEKMALLRHAGAVTAPSDMPASLRTWLFVGFVIMNTSLFFALTRWAAYLRRKPGTRQAPVWMLITVLVSCGLALVLAFSTHSAYVAALPVAPTGVSWGYILFQVLATSAALVALVLIGVRWSPGYHRRLGQM